MGPPSCVAASSFRRDLPRAWMGSPPISNPFTGPPAGTFPRTTLITDSRVTPQSPLPRLPRSAPARPQAAAQTPIRETQDSQTPLVKLPVAILIVRLLLSVLVHGAVQLDDEPVFRSIAVHDVAVERLLAPKLEAVEPAVAQTFPQASFRGRAGPAQLARSSGGRSIAHRH